MVYMPSKGSPDVLLAVTCLTYLLITMVQWGVLVVYKVM
jgi:hypothetical protein